jgi:hypothetical protein
MGGTPQLILYVFVFFFFFNFLLLFNFFSFFFFSSIIFVLCFSRTKGTSVQVCGCAMSHANPNSSPSPRVSSFHVIYTLWTMCNLSLGVWGTCLHTFCPIFEKEKKMHVHVVSKFFVDFKIVIWLFISELKILNT